MKEEITPEQQAAWFENFSKRDVDRMFVVEQTADGNWQKIGCMGFRLLSDEGCVDAYNIIRSRKIEPADFTFADPFRLMLGYAHSLYPDLPIRCKVLRDNPAVQWYERNGFSRIDDAGEYLLMELDLKAVSKLDLAVSEQI